MFDCIITLPSYMSIYFKELFRRFMQNKADKSASNSLNPSIFEGLVTLCAPDAVCFSRHVPHASGRILAERFYVIGKLRSNFLLHKEKEMYVLKSYIPFSEVFLLYRYLFIILFIIIAVILFIVRSILIRSIFRRRSIFCAV